MDLLDDGVWVFRIGYHTGFGGIHTVETTDPLGLLRELRARPERVDWSEIYGAYRASSLPDPPAFGSLRPSGEVSRSSLLSPGVS